MLETHCLKEISARWRQFGLMLGIPTYELGAIGPRQTIEESLERLLSVWIEKQKQGATVAALIKACKDFGNHALAEELESPNNRVIQNILTRSNWNMLHKMTTIHG